MRQSFKDVRTFFLFWRAVTRIPVLTNDSGVVLQTFLQMVQTTLSYFIMLIFMTFNSWLCGSVICGLTFGSVLIYRIHWLLSMTVFYSYCNPVLWNRNYFLRFRFRLLKSYGSGSGSNFWKVLVPVPVPVPTFEKLRFRFRFQLHI